jgi:hypothetical protein
MREFSPSLYDPPKSFEGGSAFAKENQLRSVPMAAAFTRKGLRSDICRTYGYISLLGQNLEVELRECLLNLELALALRGRKKRYSGSPEKAKFEKLIQMFEKQLDLSHKGSRNLVDCLHRARKLRNLLIHGFFSPQEVQYFRTAGGEAKMYEKLKKCETVFFPIIGLVSMVSRAYAADFGFTNEVFDRIVKAQKDEQAQIEADLKEIFGKRPPDISDSQEPSAGEE